MISTARLTMAMGFFRRRRRPSFQKLTLSRMTDRLSFSESLAGAKSSTLSCMLKICFLFSIPSLSSRLFQLDPRIDDLVHDVHDHVHRDDERGQEDRGSHDDHIIAPVMELTKLSPSPGIVKIFSTIRLPVSV